MLESFPVKIRTKSEVFPFEALAGSESHKTLLGPQTWAGSRFQAPSVPPPAVVNSFMELPPLAILHSGTSKIPQPKSSTKSWAHFLFLNPPPGHVDLVRSRQLVSSPMQLSRFFFYIYIKNFNYCDWENWPELCILPLWEAQLQNA